MSDQDTQPTIETMLEEMRKGFAAMVDQFTALNAQLSKMVAQLDRTDRRQSHQDSKLDAFIEEVIEMKRSLKHPV
jgi:uncharacterized protein YeeX (DUF496 family)